MSDEKIEVVLVGGYFDGQRARIPPHHDHARYPIPSATPESVPDNIGPTDSYVYHAAEYTRRKFYGNHKRMDFFASVDLDDDAAFTALLNGYRKAKP